MRKAVRQPVNNISRQADAKVTATDSSIPDYAANLIQASRWHFGVCMQEPENIAARHAGASVHLHRTAAFAAPNKLIAKPRSKLVRAVGACTIDHNDFRSSRSLAQMLEKGAYQRRLIKNWNDDRELHSDRFFKSLSTGFAWLLPGNLGLNGIKCFRHASFKQVE